MHVEEHDYIDFIIKLKTKIVKFEDKYKLYSKNTEVSLSDVIALIERATYIYKLEKLRREKIFSVTEIKKLYQLIGDRDEQTRKLARGIIDGKIPAKKRNKNTGA